MIYDPDYDMLYLEWLSGDYGEMSWREVVHHAITNPDEEEDD